MASNVFLENIGNGIVQSTKAKYKLMILGHLNNLDSLERMHRIA